MSTDEIRAEALEWQARCRDLETSLERVREELDNYKESTRVAMVHINRSEQQTNEMFTRVVELERELATALSTIDRLRLHIQQGTEL